MLAAMLAEQENARDARRDARRCSAMPAMLGDAPDPRDARPMLKHRAVDPTFKEAPLELNIYNT